MARTVVIVDDSRYIIDLLSKFFQEKMQFSVIGTGTSGRDAIELYRKLKPDLLSLDIVMPNQNGFAVIEELIRTFPDAKILIVSAVRGESLIDCVNKGAADFISKPLTFHNPAFVRHFEMIVNQIIP
jgi:two-component system chemotaxis response regulator CheY